MIVDFSLFVSIGLYAPCRSTFIVPSLLIPPGLQSEKVFVMGCSREAPFSHAVFIPTLAVEAHIIVAQRGPLTKRLLKGPLQQL